MSLSNKKDFVIFFLDYFNGYFFYYYHSLITEKQLRLKKNPFR